MQMKKIVLFICCSLLLCSISYADNLKLDQFIIKKMEQYHVPGASIAIIDGSKISYKKAYGYADIKSKRKLTPETYLQACSISKAPSALAVLLTLLKNKLSIDDPANKFLTTWKIPNNKFTAKQAVTVRMLLNHSAGIINPYKYPIPDYTYPTNLQFLNGKKPATNPALTAQYLPGSKYEYCNGCYVIIKTLLEDINKKSFPQIMKSMVLKPLQMHHSSYDPNFPFDNPKKIALPYTPKGKVFPNAGFLKPQYRKSYTVADSGLAVGGLWTTPSDLATFAIAIQKSLAKSKKSVIPNKIAEELVKPSSSDTRGLGFFIQNKYGDETKDGKYFGHGGFNPGYLSLLIAGKDNGKGAIIIINVSPAADTEKVKQWDFIKNVEHYIADHEKWD